MRIRPIAEVATGQLGRDGALNFEIATIALTIHRGVIPS